MPDIQMTAAEMSKRILHTVGLEDINIEYFTLLFKKLRDIFALF